MPDLLGLECSLLLAVGGDLGGSGVLGKTSLVLPQSVHRR